LRRSLPARLVVAGAAYDGVGIPVCIRSGRAAARELCEALVGD
jgi:oxygen-dependent protoporphyrinogen oxidase